MERINTTAIGVPVVITQHFQKRWEQRIGGRIFLPLAEIARELRDMNTGTYRVLLERSDAWAIVERDGTELRFLTVVNAPYSGRTTPPVNLKRRT